MIEAAAIGLGALNVIACICRHAPMSARTHKWGPMLLFMALGIASAGLCWAAAEWSADYALVGQLGVSAVLLHTFPSYRNGPPLEAWRDSKLIHRGEV
jgi:hypothetical protein